MKKTFLVFVSFFLLLSCGTTSSLYYWGGVQNSTTAYENLAYHSYDKQTPESLCKLICVYEDMVVNPGGIRKIPPPGICAEYGYLLLLPSTAETFMKAATERQKRIFDTDDYASFFFEKGKILLQKEMEYYPESIKFIEPLLKRMTY